MLGIFTLPPPGSDSDYEACDSIRRRQRCKKIFAPAISQHDSEQDWPSSLTNESAFAARRTPFAVQLPSPSALR